MPYERVIEMLCDFVGASMAYNKKQFSVKDPLAYWKSKCEGKRAMHEDSEKLFVKLLEKLAEFDNLNDFIDWYNKHKTKLEKDY
jgi:hypothetical protein